MEENQVHQIHIPQGWFEDIVLELCHIGRGRVISQKEITENIGEYPVYSSQTQNNGEMGRIDTFDFEGDYITWTTDGANAGTVFYRTGRFNCTNVCGTLQEKDKNIDLKFLAYKLSTVAKKHVSYIGNPKLMNGTMSKVSLVIPKSKLEQTQIAAILSKVDEAITQTEKLIAKYNRIKTGLMQDLLTKGIDENGNIRSEETHEFKNSPLGRIPNEWECEKLERYGSFSKGSTISKSLLSDNGVNCILYGELYTKYDIYATEIFSKVPFEFVREKQPLKYGDILFAGSGETHEDIGKCITFIGHKPTYAGGDIVIFRSKHFNPIFLSMLLNSFKLNIQKSALGQGSSVIHIYPNHLKMLDVIFPDKVEQDRIAEIILKNEMYINDLETNLSKLYSLKTGLMQDLLSGKVRVNHLIKETANL
ncbi:restriction endonuclease subunit S [Lacinutrix chionoecetis]